MISTRFKVARTPTTLAVTPVSARLRRRPIDRLAVHSLHRLPRVEPAPQLQRNA
jgi:hypothetical protein